MTCSFASDEHKDTCLHSFTHVLLNLSVVVAMRLSESLFKNFIQLDQSPVSLMSFFDSYRYRIPSHVSTPSPPILDHTGTVKAHLEVSDGVPCGLQHILALDPSKRYLETAMAWTQSWACITSAFRRRTCEENPQIITNVTIQLIHRDLAEQVFKMYSGLSQSLLIISDRKLLSCHEPSIPVSSHVGWKVPTKTRPQ